MVDRLIDVEVLVLDADELVRIQGREAHAEAVVRQDHDEAARLLIIDAVDLVDDDLSAVLRLLHDAGLRHELEENERGSVRHRRLFRIELDVGIVDAVRVERAHQVLDREHLVAVLLHRRRAQCRRDILGLRVDLRLTREILAHEDDARILWRWLQRRMDLTAGMQPDARIRDFCLQCSLFLQNHTPCRNMPYSIVQNNCLRCKSADHSSRMDFQRSCSQNHSSG